MHATYNLDICIMWMIFGGPAGMPSPAIRTLEFACSLDLIQCSNSELNLFEILLDSFCKEGLVWEASLEGI